MSIAAPKILVEKAKVRVSHETAYNALMAGRNGETIFSQELAAEICSRLADGESLRAICSSDPVKFPTETAVRYWVLEDREGFASQYARARDLGLDVMADEVLSIADDGSRDYRKTDKGVEVDYDHIARSKLRFDARRWYLSKLAPKRYGDAQLIKHADHEGNAMHVKVTRVKGRED